MDLEENVEKRIRSLVEQNRVVLFMKGNPSQPQCGFSAQTVDVLNRVLDTYESFDVLQDTEVREGIKTFSDWPTIPQLYINGEFQGGCDIVKEMYSTGELHGALGLEAPAGVPPAIALTEDARKLLEGAREQYEGQPLHLQIDARFQTSLGFGPLSGGEVEADCDGFSIFLDADSAHRAGGMTIDAVGSGEQMALRIENPNAPPKVKQMPVQELASLMEQGPIHLFDVRTAEEKERAAIPNARLLDESVRAEIAALPKDAVIVFHCHHGQRSQAEAERWLAQGFTNVFNLMGGVDAWSQQVDPSVARY